MILMFYQDAQNKFLRHLVDSVASLKLEDGTQQSSRIQIT